MLSERKSKRTSGTSQKENTSSNMDKVEVAGNELASKVHAQFQLSAKGRISAFL